MRIRPDVTFLARSQIQTIETSFAVLDLHFSRSDPNLLAVAGSTGVLCFYYCEVDVHGDVSLKNISTVRVADPSILVLSLAWGPSPAYSSTIAFSLSNGQIGIFDVKFPDAPLRFMQAHSLEAWTVAWSVSNNAELSPVLYSGGDDSTLCGNNVTKLLSPSKIDDSLSSEPPHGPVIRDIKTHSAGVTAILPLLIDSSEDQKILLTGSYDEYVRVISPAMPGKRSSVLAEKHLRGGVWRLKCLDLPLTETVGQDDFTVLASCMHAGAKVLKIEFRSGGHCVIKVIADFEEHQSMNYACDARGIVTENGSKSIMCISTSFYDKKLCLWNVPCD